MCGVYNAVTCPSSIPLDAPKIIFLSPIKVLLIRTTIPVFY